MLEARFTGYNHYHDGEELEDGDIVELTPQQYEQWSYQFELVTSDSDSSASADTTDSHEMASEPSEADSDNEQGDSTTEEENADESDSEATDDQWADDLLSENVNYIQEQLQTGEFDDHLDELEVIERSNEDRVTVLDAIGDRRD